VSCPEVQGVGRELGTIMVEIERSNARVLVLRTRDVDDYLGHRNQQHPTKTSAPNMKTSEIRRAWLSSVIEHWPVGEIPYSYSSAPNINYLADEQSGMRRSVASIAFVPSGKQLVQNMKGSRRGSTTLFTFMQGVGKGTLKTRSEASSAELASRRLNSP
jgi:hypothetical protein